MVMKAMQQLLHEVDWGSLDMLVLDLPPGTGDTQLTITQQVFLDGKSPSRATATMSLLTLYRLCHRDDSTHTSCQGCSEGYKYVQEGQR